MSPHPPEELVRVQAFLQAAFRNDALLTDHGPLGARIAEHITGNDRLTPAEQAELYREQFFLRHVDSLIEDHPGLVFYLGDDQFSVFARSYLAAHPPKTPSLRDLGADIASFAASSASMPEHLRELATDMARYELCVIDLFDCTDAPPRDTARLAALPEEAWLTKSLVFTPILRLFEFRHRVPELRRAIKQGELTDREPPPAAPVYYGIFRTDEGIVYEHLSAEAYALLLLLQGGEPLGSACEKLSQSIPEERVAQVEAEVGTWFQQWASWGWILDVKMS